MHVLASISSRHHAPTRWPNAGPGASWPCPSAKLRPFSDAPVRSDEEERFRSTALPRSVIRFQSRADASSPPRRQHAAVRPITPRFSNAAGEMGPIRWKIRPEMSPNGKYPNSAIRLLHVPPPDRAGRMVLSRLPPVQQKTNRDGITSPECISRWEGPRGHHGPAQPRRINCGRRAGWHKARGRRGCRSATSSSRRIGRESAHRSAEEALRRAGARASDLCHSLHMMLIFAPRGERGNRALTGESTPAGLLVEESAWSGSDVQDIRLRLELF